MENLELFPQEKRIGVEPRADGTTVDLEQRVRDTPETRLRMQLQNMTWYLQPPNTERWYQNYLLCLEDERLQTAIIHEPLPTRLPNVLQEVLNQQELEQRLLLYAGIVTWYRQLQPEHKFKR